MKQMVQRFCVLVICAVLGGCLTTQIADEDLVYWCTFDTKEAVLSPVVGPSGVVRDVAVFKEDAGHRALLVPVGAGVVDVAFPQGIPAERGCIEFDAKILATKDFYREGGDPRFFEIRAPLLSGWNFVALCDFNANNGVGDSGLYTQIGHAVMTSVNGRTGCRPYSSILGEDFRGWHHYSIRWNVKGIEGSQTLADVRVDGREITTYPLVGMDLEKFKKRMLESSVIHFANSFETIGSGNCKTPFLLDDFKIWKTDAPVHDR